MISQNITNIYYIFNYIIYAEREKEEREKGMLSVTESNANNTPNANK